MILKEAQRITNPSDKQAVRGGKRISKELKDDDYAFYRGKVNKHIGDQISPPPSNG